MVEPTKEEDVKDQTFIDQPAILDKYKAAALIADGKYPMTQIKSLSNPGSSNNRGAPIFYFVMFTLLTCFIEAMKKAIELCVVGADVHGICQQVDLYIVEECLKVFNGKKAKKLDRGLAFPTCVSLNNVVGHYSPMADESIPLKDGDLAKIICGVQIDGYAANSAHTIIVGDINANKETAAKKANVIMAAHSVIKAAERAIRDGSNNQDVTLLMNKVAAEFECNILEGLLSHIVKKYCIDGNKAIIGKEVPLQMVEDWTFQPGEVFHLDVYVSSGEGKPKLAEHRTTVYKRELQNMYSLKLQKSRAFFAEANKRYPSLPFSLRAFEDQIGAKVGVKECVDHDLMQPFPVLIETEGEFVAHFKSTVCVLPRSTAILAGNVAFDASKYACASHSIKDEELKTAVTKDLWKKL